MASLALLGKPREFYRALFCLFPCKYHLVVCPSPYNSLFLQEMGHLKSFMAACRQHLLPISMISIGIVVLTCVPEEQQLRHRLGLGKVLMNFVLFFATAVGGRHHCPLRHEIIGWTSTVPHQRITIVRYGILLPWPASLGLPPALRNYHGAYIAGHRSVHSGRMPLCGAPGGHQQLCCLLPSGLPPASA